MRIVIVAALVAALAGCGESLPSPSPSGSAAPSPSGSAAASPSPTAEPTAAFACPVAPATLPVPSNRLVAVAVTSREGRDEVRFTFGPDGQGSAAPPAVEIGPATPPFVKSPSGFPLEVAGDAFIRLTFRDTIVADQAGSPTLGTAQTLTPGGPAVKEVVEAEAFEGVADWLVGIAAPGCARVSVDTVADTLTLEVQVP